MIMRPISKKGYILIPKPLRKRLGIKTGGRVIIEEVDQSLVLRPVPDDPIAAAAGCLKGKDSILKDFLDEKKRERDRERKKFGL